MSVPRRGSPRRPVPPGRDPKAELHPAVPGRPGDDRRHHVAVLGGGIAGLAAASALAERGVRVTLVEKEARLGGRVRSWPVSVAGTPTTMSRGFHAFFRQYYNLRALLGRADAVGRLVPVTDYPLVSADGTRDSFVGIARTPPLNLATFVLRSDSFTLRDLFRVDVAAALEMVDVRFPETFAEHDGESAAAYLQRLRFPPAARHLALEVFARSFFADPDDFSAGELIAMFHAYFLGSAEGLLFDVPDDDYDTALWAPLARHLTRSGVDLRTSTSVEGVRRHQDGAVLVETTDGSVQADALVVATDPGTTQRLLADPAVVGDEEWRRRLAGTRQAPSFAVWRLWLDRPVDATRPPFLGTAGFEFLDNVSVLERFERGAADWARRHGGSVVELHAYALADDTADERVTASLRASLDGLYPELRDARVVGECYERNADCPLVGTDPWNDRPGVATPDPRIVLAGDGVRCDFPVALMERAATTGFLAANQLLQSWQVQGHDVWTVPTSARLPVRRLRAWASRRKGSGQPTSPARTA